jgi:hypothetical protein
VLRTDRCSSTRRRETLIRGGSSVRGCLQTLRPGGGVAYRANALRNGFCDGVRSTEYCTELGSLARGRGPEIDCGQAARCQCWCQDDPDAIHCITLVIQTLYDTSNYVNMNQAQTINRARIWTVLGPALLPHILLPGSRSYRINANPHSYTENNL